MKPKFRHTEYRQLFEQIERKFRAEGVDPRNVFACDDLVYIWDPARLAAAPQLIERDRENAAIVLYARHQGRQFGSLKEAHAFYTGPSLRDDSR